MFAKIGQYPNVKKDNIRNPLFRKVGAEFQYKEGQGQNSNIYKNRGRMPM